MNKKSIPGLGLGILLLLIGAGTWIYQLKNGLIVTDMRNSFNWGLYIATFAFLVGLAAGGLIISSSVYLFNLVQLKPFTRLASLSAFVCTLGAMSMVLADLGRVGRVFNLLLHPNIRSPLIWDVIVLTLYLIITFFSFYMQMLPEWKDKGQWFFNGWTRKYSEEKLQAFSHKWSKRVALIGLPFAILIHTVTALIFATQASRPWWNTAILPPDFIAVAVASGTALVMLMAMLAVGRDGFHQYADGFKTMARIVSGALMVHFFFVAVDLLIHGWWGTSDGAGVMSLLFGGYRWLYAIELTLTGFIMIYFIAFKRPKRLSLISGSILLFIGVMIHRLMLMFPSFNEIPLSLSLPGMGGEGWTYPIALGQFKAGEPVFVDFWAYIPTLAEWAIILLPFGIILILTTLAISSYQVLPASPHQADYCNTSSIAD